MSRLGLVLSGGASRGAYAAGVMRFMYLDLPKRLGWVPWPDVVSGTSVGALNGMFAAARSAERIERLSRLWQTLTIPSVYHLAGGGVFGALQTAFRPVEGRALLDATPMYTLVRRESPIDELRESLDRGRCRGFVVSCTELSTGANVLFVDAPVHPFELDPAPGTHVRRCRLRPRHVLASGALPFLFPPVPVDGQLYVDGGLRQNTPLRPVIRAGADRVLLIGSHISREQEGLTPLAQVNPTLPFLAGKTLNALMVDPVERDLIQVESTNQVLEWVARRCGPEVLAAARDELGVGVVRTLFLRPKRDLGRLAADVYRTNPPRVGGAIDRLLAFTADRAATDGEESDLLSYLLFDGAYTGAVEALGFEEAKAREEEIVRFLTDPGASRA